MTEIDIDKELSELKSWLDETKNEPLEGMAAFFDARISDYEEHMSRWARHYQWLSGLVPQSTRTLLDIGCGSGLELDCIFARLPDIRVTGVDMSEKMLELLAEKHSDKSLEIIQADYFQHDLGEEQFDCAVAFETLHHYSAEKKTQLFSKVYRALKKGGVYLECDYIAGTEQIERLLFSECQRRRNRDGFADDTFVHFDTPLTAKHELEAIKAAGFESVELIGFLPGDFNTAMIRAVKREIIV